MSDGYPALYMYVMMEITSSDNACARKVKSLIPLANGMTWVTGSGECYAYFSTDFYENSAYRGCMFGGK